MPPVLPPNQPPAAAQAAPTAAPAGPNVATQQIATDVATTRTNAQNAITALLAAVTAAAEPNAQQQVIDNVVTTRTNAQNAITALQAAVTAAPARPNAATQQIGPNVPPPPVQPVTSPQALPVTPKKFREKTVEAAGAATKLAVPTGLVAAGVSIADWPILGRIPYLPEAAQWTQKSILSASNFLGVNTGTAATTSWLAALPNWVGPTAVAAGGLWGLGKFSEWLTLREKSGFNVLKTMWNGTRLVYDLPKVTLGKVWQWTKSPFTKKENIINRSVVGIKNIVRDWAWNPLIKPVVHPTKLGVGVGILGAVFGNALTGGSPLVIAGTLYGIGNYLTNKGHLAGAPSSPAAVHGK